MKQIMRATKAFGLLSIIALSFSFTSMRGGEGFQVYLNKKLVLERYGDNMKAVQTLDLSQAAASDELTIKYHHCGRVGKNRMVTIRDASNKVLKEWKFADVNSVAAGMTCKIKDITGLQKNGAGKLKLYYSSSELLTGRQLASISLAGSTTASR